MDTDAIKKLAGLAREMSDRGEHFVASILYHTAAAISWGKTRELASFIDLKVLEFRPEGVDEGLVDRSRYSPLKPSEN